MLWTVEFDDVFAEEFSELDEDVKVELAAMIILLGRFGPQLGRPHVDTLKGSKHANMKELRFKAAGGVWRVAFAFDPARCAILLVAGDKSRMSERRFYRDLLRTADQLIRRSSEGYCRTAEWQKQLMTCFAKP